MAIKEKIIALIEVIRPLNGLIAGLSVFIAVFLAGHPIGYLIWLVALSCFFITSGGNAINDLVDESIDRVNKPKRPIPSGRLSNRETLFFSIFLSIVGVLLGGVVSLQLLEIAIPAAILLYLYSFFLKREGFKGNIAIAFLGGLPFVYGGVAVGSIQVTIIPFIFAFFLHLSRELTKDIEDMQGDKGYARTFPLLYGTRKTIKLIDILLGLLIAFTLVPYIAGIYNLPYLIGVILLVDIPLLLFLYLINKRRISFSHAVKMLKLCMLGGMVSLVLAGVGWLVS